MRQKHFLDLIPNSGIAITMDIGDESSIHPTKEKEVADRLFFTALYLSYGYKTIDYAAPIFDSQSVTSTQQFYSADSWVETNLIPSLQQDLFDGNHKNKGV